MRSRPVVVAAWNAVAALALVALGGCERAPLPAASGPGPTIDAGGGSDGGGGVADAGVEGGRVPPLDWGNPVGTEVSPSLPGATHVTAVVPVADGGAVVSGSFAGSVSFAADKTLVDDGSSSGFVARFRHDQRLVWVTQIHGDRVTVSDLAGVGNDEVVASGWFAGTLRIDQLAAAPITAQSRGGLDAFVVRLAADGSVRWLTPSGGPGDDIARAVAALVSGTDGSALVAFTGAVGDAVVFGAGPAAQGPSAPGSGPIYVARLDGNGKVMSVSYAGAGIPGQGYGVAIDGLGATVATGFVNGPAPFGTSPSGAPVTVDPADGRAFVGRWDVSGRLEWALPLAGPNGEGDAITIGTGGEIVACGQFEDQAAFGRGPSAPRLTADSPGSQGTYLVGLDASGATLWARRLAGIGVRPWHVRAARDGALLVAGWFGGGILVDPDGPSPMKLFSAGGDEAMFIRLHADGGLDWALGGGGPGDDEGFDLAEAPDGTLFAVGDYAGPATFGVGAAAVTLESGTDGNGFLLHLGRN
jgi:hypothetical protein